MRPSVELMVWRASLAEAPPVPDAAMLEDWAGVLAAAGEDGTAAMLRDAAALWRGVPPLPGASAPRRTIEILLAELDEIAAAFPYRPEPTRAAPPAPLDDLAAAGARLVAFLSSPGAEGAETVAAILASLAEARARLPALDYRTMADAPLCELGFAVALTALAGFAMAVRDLAAPPLGSVAFLHRVARLDREGLGPYLSGVGRVARTSTDLFEFAHRAAGPDATGDALAAWIALLARDCPAPLLLDVIDDLGDANHSAALSLILERLLSRFAGVDLHAVRRLRDAALDNADWRLAARAQAAIARLRPLHRHERVVLGSIEASGGDYGAAEATFLDHLLLHPDDEDAARRLLAVRQHRFDGFRVLQGYTSPPGRAEHRHRRRGIVPAYATRRGERVSAVEVT